MMQLVNAVEAQNKIERLFIADQLLQKTKAEEHFDGEQ